MKYAVTVFAMVVALVYGGWIFALEASTKSDPMVAIEKAGAGSVACVFLGIFLFLAIFATDKSEEVVEEPDDE